MPEDVQEESSASEQVQDAAPAVTGEEKQQERPIQNVIGEYNRKMAKLQEDNRAMLQRLDAISQYLVAGQQQVQQAPPTAQDADEALWARAQAGDRLAFEEYQARIASRVYQKNQTVNTRAQTVQAQIMAITQKYPVMNDPQNPLTQTVQQAYQLMLRAGYTAGPETMLDAMKTAIAERPDLVSELYSQNAQTRNAARRSATSVAQSGQTGSTVRSEPAPAKDGVKVRPSEVALARRMGLDPDKAKKAKERFLKRQESGQSALGAVSSFVQDQAEDF